MGTVVTGGMRGPSALTRVKPGSPALEGGFLTTRPPEKFHYQFFFDPGRIWFWAFLCLKVFLITNSLYLLDCSYFLFLHDSVLVGCMFLGLFLFIPDYPIGCCSVTKLCLTLCDPMDCSMPGLSVPHHLPEFAQVHVH